MSQTKQNPCGLALKAIVLFNCKVKIEEMSCEGESKIEVIVKQNVYFSGFCAWRWHMNMEFKEIKFSYTHCIQ